MTDITNVHTSQNIKTWNVEALKTWHYSEKVLAEYSLGEPPCTETHQFQITITVNFQNMTGLITVFLVHPEIPSVIDPIHTNYDLSAMKNGKISYDTCAISDFAEDFHRALQIGWKIACHNPQLRDVDDCAIHVQRT